MLVRVVMMSQEAQCYLKKKKRFITLLPSKLEIHHHLLCI
jgi:hypothetical protein